MFEAIGGRKFVMTVLIMAAGIAVELKSPTGMSMTMAGFLAGILATFSASNALISAKFASAAGESSVASGEGVNAEAVSKMDSLMNNQVLLAQGVNEVLAKQETSDKALQTLQTSTASVQKTLVAFLSTRQGA